MNYRILMGLLVIIACPIGCSKDEATSTAPHPSTEPAAEEVPEFPLPAPKASAMMTVPREFLIQEKVANTVGDVAHKLEAAFDKTGYVERSYFAVRDGFAIVARMEQIETDGTSKPLPNRWALTVSPVGHFTLISYLKALFEATQGHYRLLVFVVSPHVVVQRETPIAWSQARDWLSEGTAALPRKIAGLPYTDEYDCTALVYEFEKPSDDSDAVPVEPSALPARTHLERAGLWRAFEARP